MHSIYMHPWTVLDEEKQNTIEILHYQCTIRCISLLTAAHEDGPGNKLTNPLTLQLAINCGQNSFAEDQLEIHLTCNNTMKCI